MKPRSKFLIAGASIAVLSTVSLFGMAAGNFSFLRATGTETIHWKHYAAVEESEDTHGSKEFWASCDDLGYHVFVEPTQGTIEEGGDFAKTSFFADLAYGDDRYIPSLFETRNAVYPTLVDAHTLHYGLYPQSVIHDPTFIATLNALSDEDIGPNRWYLYQGAYYAKLETSGSLMSGQRFDNGDSIGKKKTYWFTCSPIEWKILANEEGNAYALSTLILDSGCYYSGTAARTIDEKTVNPNNYRYSDVRTWLNGSFYSKAFALGDAYIKTTTVDNSAKTTDTGMNPYACEDTEDKVFLPSYRDYKNVDYGFINSEEETSSRQSRTSEWSRASGAGVDYGRAEGESQWCGHYWTRSPKSTYMRDVHSIAPDGYIEGSSSNPDYRGVRPAITVEL